MSDSRPVLSVAISTFNREPRLAGLIESLERQTLPAASFEVVVVDDGSSDRTFDTLMRLSRESSLVLRPVRTATNQGQAAGRNQAWRASRGAFVAFTDDDCRPDAGWLEAGLAALEAGADVVAGRTAPRAEDERLAEGPFARTIRSDRARFFETCNVFYRREALEAVDGFDESFGVLGGEDTDLAMRVLRTGRQAAFAPDALVHHDVRPSDWWATLRDTRRWRALPRVVGRHPGLRSELHRRLFWKRSHPPAIAAGFGLLVGAWPRRTRRTHRRLRVLAAAGLVAPWLYYRTRTAPLCPGKRRRWVVLPGALVIDLAEVAVMVRGSLEYHSLML
jgi:GT2 family glycosyltransferase